MPASEVESKDTRLNRDEGRKNDTLICAMGAALRELAALLLELLLTMLVFLYHYLLLLRLSTMPCYSQTIEDFHRKNSSKTSSSSFHEAWTKLLNYYEKSLRTVSIDCHWLLGFSACLLIVQITCMTGQTTLPPTLSALACACSFNSLAIAHLMTRHVSSPQDRLKAKHWWKADERARRRPFVATSALLAAPAAWRAWACIAAAASLMSCPGCAFHIEYLSSMFGWQTTTQSSSLIQKALALIMQQQQQQQPLHISFASVILVGIVGSAHCWFVIVYFSRLGYGSGGAQSKAAIRTRTMLQSIQARGTRSIRPVASNVPRVHSILDEELGQLEEGRNDSGCIQLDRVSSLYYTPLPSPT